MLPEPSDPAGEDALVAAWTEREDPDGLVALIEAAIAARRTALAARLVGLLPDDHGDDRPALDRARAAAKLVLHRRLEPVDNSWSALEEAWHDLHRAWVRRLKRGQRQRMEGNHARVPRVDRDRDRRRR
ncbi:MAG: hypothetical protein H6733_11050 [Alphaproteobacteria bacterium]|nr:hypothetical protein [Alphaproteobacteria bacterium]